MVKTKPQIASDLVIQYIKPTVRKYNLPVDYFDERCVRIWVDLIHAEIMPVRLFRQWMLNVLPK